jgi:hypothetical protein
MEASLEAPDCDEGLIAVGDQVQADTRTVSYCSRQEA